jgi:hypothetical protein
MDRTKRIKVELAKVRADPDYYPPICLRCGRTFDVWPDENDHSLGAELLRLNAWAVWPEDACEILCVECVEAEIIEQAKELGEWDEVEIQMERVRQELD